MIIWLARDSLRDKEGSTRVLQAITIQLNILVRPRLRSVLLDDIGIIEIERPREKVSIPVIDLSLTLDPLQIIFPALLLNRVGLDESFILGRLSGLRFVSPFIVHHLLLLTHSHPEGVASLHGHERFINRYRALFVRWDDNCELGEALVGGFNRNVAAQLGNESLSYVKT